MQTPSRLCRITGKSIPHFAAEEDLRARIAAQNPHLGASLPPPSLHPVESVRRLATFGALTHLYRGASALSGKPQLTRFNPAFGHRICTQEEYWSDRVDNTEFGRPYDFSRSFFEQWHELMKSVYLLPLTNTRAENSEYANGAQDVKNCYLCFATSSSQDCLYCHTHYHGNDNVDCVNSVRSQLCYSCSDLDNCYQCAYCTKCETCADCIGCWDCVGCNSCTGCVGLDHARNCFFNQQLSPDEYARRVSELELSSYAARELFLKRVTEHFAASEHKANTLINCEDATGAYVRNSQHVTYCFNTRNSTDCGFMIAAQDCKDCWKGYGVACEMNYYSVNYNAYNCHFSYAVFASQSCWYSFLLSNQCSHCFGCVGLKQKSYSILNKEYSKQEYFELVPRIVAQMKAQGEWGEFFPAHLSPHTYDESWAEDYLTEIPASEVVRRGYHTEAIQERVPPAGSLLASELPDRLESDAHSSVAGRSIVCAETGLAYSFQESEVAFYLRHAIPLPRRHWRVRLQTLVRRRARMDEDEVGAEVGG